MMTSKDFFISYTGADIAWAEWIAQTLEDAGYHTVLQAWDFRPGDNFIERMNQALADADRVIAVLSPAYFDSEYAKDEWTAALIRARGERDRLLPVRISECEPPPLLADRIYIDLVDLDPEAAAEQLLVGVQYGRAKPEEKRAFPGTGNRSSAVSFPGRHPAIFEVPPRLRYFTGRGDLLQALRRQLVEAGTGTVVQAAAVHGLGGVGKTQLAIEYTYRYAADFDLVWWIPSEQPSTISDRLAQLGRRLGLEELPRLEEQVGRVFDALGQRDRWLLVYDNAQRPSDLKGLRPPAGSGQVLVTSRNPAWGGVAATVPVNVLSREHAVAFLARRTNSSDESTLVKLAGVLGDLPLALEQAAAFLEETSSTPEEYLQLFSDRAKELFTLGQPASTEETIATTWAVSLDRLKIEAPGARDLLTLCAFLAPDDLPRWLLAEYGYLLPERVASAMMDKLEFHKVLGALRRYSLISVTADELGVHRLVQAVIRHRLDAESARMWAAATVRLLAAAFPSQAENIEVWSFARQLLPHALAAADQAEALQADPLTTAKLLDAAGRYLWGRGDHHQAKILHQRALALCEAQVGPEHPHIAFSHQHLGVVLADLGELDAARYHFEQALTLHESRLGPYHPEIARSLDNLGATLYDQGDLDGARKLHERALILHASQLGAKHPDTAYSLNNLAEVMHDQGHIARARRLHEHALAIREEILGADHPDTAYSLNNLACILHRQGDLAGARRLHERALSIREELLGADHPDTAQSLSNLAALLLSQGDLAEARRVSERVLAVREARAGADHPDTARSLNLLASVLIGEGDLAGARRLNERALNILETCMGPDHVLTETARRNLAAVDEVLRYRS
jgi:tetratricopeptide (TPR) repeat protein